HLPPALAAPSTLVFTYTTLFRSKRLAPTQLNLRPYARYSPPRRENRRCARRAARVRETARIAGTTTGTAGPVPGQLLAPSTIFRVPSGDLRFTVVDFLSAGAAHTLSLTAGWRPS